MNLFRILQRHYPQFMDTLRFQITSRREFERLKDSDPSTLTDLERAGRFLYLQRTAFGGKVSGQNFGVDTRSAASFNLTRLAPLLEEVHERLTGVTVECLDWLASSTATIVRACCSTSTRLTPEHYYGAGLFSRDQFVAMAERLGRVKGRFIMSINDVPEIREAFAAFTLEPVGLTYSVSGGVGADAKELIVSGP